MTNNVCRLCCQKEATSYIFTKETKQEIQICTKIMYCCTNINIKEGDGLSAYICDNCERELNACHQFVLKCEASDKKLRSQALDMISQVIADLDDCAAKIEVKLESDNNSDDDHQYEEVPNTDIILKQIEHEEVDIKMENKIGNKRKPYKKRSKYKGMEPCTCTVCGRQCANPSTFKVHMRSHTNEKPYPCPSCDKRYKDSGTLKRHMDRNHIQRIRQRNFICENCGKGFFSKNDVKIHMRTHTGETPYECTMCAVRFTQISALYRHKKRHTGEKDHLCPTCPKKFCTKEELKSHLIVHSSEKNYACPLCNVLFKYQNNLKKHIRLHSEPNRFVCNHCGRTFNVKGNLKIHIDKQHSEKSGHCTVCSKNVSNIEVHMWRHTGQRPLKCELCTSSFYELKALARHMNFRHKKTDRYKCEVEGCLMTFPSRPMLDFHTAKLHGTHIPFPCDRCTRAFYRKNDLARHKIGTHKERLL
ncbi:unnamed protein product [Chrysodeixis includens]|uniref:Zinc finger protein n=1 Tax=Chrysodeixis includens TaxID=689277 RepID=A0A9P0C048_CHRIL|nr:unnamed protein product [Chrysodeixis includens]